jgi:hypothetical protein
MAVSRPMSCVTGKANAVAHGDDRDDGVRLAQRLCGTLRDSSFLPAVYPALFGEGIDEGSLHSYMLSALVLVGDRLGFSPVADAPIFDRLDKLLMGEGAKRPDAIWFQRGQDEIRLLMEFERFTSRSLAPKARNLLVMSKELQPAPRLVVLNYWTYTPVASDALREVQAVFAHGFRHPNGVMFPPLTCPALALETLVAAKGARASVQAVTPRLFVHDKEDKPYIVQRLNTMQAL